MRQSELNNQKVENTVASIIYVQLVCSKLNLTLPTNKNSVKGTGSGIRLPRLMSTKPLTGCGSLGKFLNLSVTQFPDLKNVGDVNTSEGCCED